jgi:hypothetical protein
VLVLFSVPTVMKPMICSLSRSFARRRTVVLCRYPLQ